MISDTLCEARQSIEYYLAEMPQCYTGMEHELHALCAWMGALQAYLDNPLPPGDIPQAGVARL
jgi:hypothetical protein